VTDSFLAQFEAAWKPLDPDVAAILAAIYTKNKDFKLLCDMTPAEARTAVATMAPFFTHGAPALPHIEERTIPAASGPIRMRLYDPGAPAPAPTVIYLHGGGWVLCNIDLYDGVARQIAKRSGMRVLSVDYGLAPEHRFPLPLDDCIAAVRWAASEGAALGIDIGRLALAGDSAGANLALATLLALRDAGGGPKLGGAALIYGCYSGESDMPSCQAYGRGEYFLSVADMNWYWNHYLGAAAAHPDSRAAPLRADLSDLPPLYLVAAEFDVLHDDTVRLAARLKEAGVAHEFRLWKGMIHASLSLMGWIAAMGPEIDRVGAFLRRVTATERLR
jgi:acetyl esterase